MKKPDLKAQAVMHVDKGEELSGMWTSPQIPQIGVYKLIAKKRIDGKFEWVHFQHRPDGTRKVLSRGELGSKAEISKVLDAANKTLSHICGVVMQVADPAMATRDGRNAGDTIH